MASIDLLPLEVLAKCYTYLPFRGRIVAMLVSRAWRSAALEFPEVWWDIDISSRMKSPESALASALSRSGRHPVDLKVNECFPHALDQGPLITALIPHMDHVRSVDWGHNSRPTGLFSHPAPALESFRQTGLIKYRLTPHFFGGEAGRLRYLHLENVYLPETCPAVATVTHLRIDSSVDGVFHLFWLFPRLRSLTLYRIRTGHALFLFGVRPPPTLSVLQVQIVDPSVDFLDVLGSWDNDRLTDVRLIPYKQRATVDHLTSFMSDARNLVAELCAGGAARVVVQDSRARERTLILSSGDDEVIIAEGLDMAQGSLTNLRSLTISATLLFKLALRGSVALPALKELTLAVDQAQECVTDDEGLIEHDGDGEVVVRYVWPWHHLGGISAFVRSLGWIEVLTLEMRCLSGIAPPPTAEDGRKLVCEYIPRFFQPDSERAQRIRVRGLPREVSDELSSDLQALQADWDVGTILHFRGSLGDITVSRNRSKLEVGTVETARDREPRTDRFWQRKGLQSTQFEGRVSKTVSGVPTLGVGSPKQAETRVSTSSDRSFDSSFDFEFRRVPTTVISPILDVNYWFRILMFPFSP